MLSLSLIFNHNVDFWIDKEYEYYQLFFLIIFSIIIFFTSKETLQLGKVDIVVISILLFLTISRGLHLGSFNEIHVISTLSLVIYYIALKTIRLQKEQLITYYQFIIGIGTFLCGYCILELYNIIEPSSLYWEMKGNFSNPGPLGGFIAIILTLVFCELLQKCIQKKWSKLVVYLIVTALMTFVLIKSASRAAMFSAVISVTILASYYGFKKWKYFKYTLLSLLPIFIFIGISKSTDSISGRLLIWKISFLSFFENPFIGIGYNFFGVEYINFQANYFSKAGTKEEVLLAGANSQAFNEILKFVIENGLLGIILIVISCLWILKSRSTVPNFGKHQFSVASLAFYSAVIVFALFSFPLQFIPFKLILLNQIALQEYPSLPFKISVNITFWKFAGIGLCGILVFMSISQYKGYCNWKNGSELQFTNPDSAKTLYSEAYRQLKNDGAFLSHYGFFMEEINPRQALFLYETAKNIDNSPILYVKTAIIYEKEKDYKKAEENLLKLHFISPHLFKPQEKLLDFYIRRRDIEKVQLFAKEILDTPIKIPSKDVLIIKLKAKKYLN